MLGDIRRSNKRIKKNIDNIINWFLLQKHLLWGLHSSEYCWFWKWTWKWKWSLPNLCVNFGYWQFLKDIEKLTISQNPFNGPNLKLLVQDKIETVWASQNFLDLLIRFYEIYLEFECISLWLFFKRVLKMGSGLSNCGLNIW